MAQRRPVPDLLLWPCMQVSVFSGNFLHVSCAACRLLVCWAWSGFPTGGGAPGLSYYVYTLHPCLHTVLATYSEAITCLACQHACMSSADHACMTVHRSLLYFLVFPCLHVSVNICPNCPNCRNTLHICVLARHWLSDKLHRNDQNLSHQLACG